MKRYKSFTPKNLTLFPRYRPCEIFFGDETGLCVFRCLFSLPFRYRECFTLVFLFLDAVFHQIVSILYLFFLYTLHKEVLQLLFSLKTFLKIKFSFFHFSNRNVNKRMKQAILHNRLGYWQTKGNDALFQDQFLLTTLIFFEQ